MQGGTAPTALAIDQLPADQQDVVIHRDLLGSSVGDRSPRARTIGKVGGRPVVERPAPASRVAKRERVTS